MDKGAWWAAVHGVAQSWTRLKRLSMHACLGEGNSNPLQYFCLENPRDRGAWWAAVHGVAQSWTLLKRLSCSSSSSSNSSSSSSSIRTEAGTCLPFIEYTFSSYNSSTQKVLHICVIRILLDMQVRANQAFEILKTSKKIAKLQSRCVVF